MMNWRGLLASILLIFQAFEAASGHGATAREDCLHVASFTDSGLDATLSPLLRELYREAGVCLAIESVSLKRGHELMMRGQIDGQGARTGQWVAEFGPKLQSNNIRLGKISLFAVWLRGSPPASPGSFTGKVVAHHEGSAWAEIMIGGWKAHPLALPDFKNIHELLSRGRADYILLDEGFWPNTREHLDDDLDWVPFATIEIYHVLSAGHAEEAKKLEAAVTRLGGTKLVMKYLNPRSQN